MLWEKRAHPSEDFVLGFARGVDSLQHVSKAFGHANLFKIRCLLILVGSLAPVEVDSIVIAELVEIFSIVSLWRVLEVNLLQC